MAMAPVPSGKGNMFVPEGHSKIANHIVIDRSVFFACL